MDENFNIRVTVELGNKEVAETLAKKIASRAKEDESPETILMSIPYTFGATNVSEVQYMPHPTKKIGAVVMVLNCSEEQFNKNYEAVTK